MATTPARKPQDHKRTNKEVFDDLQKEFSEVEGSEHIVPLGKIKGSDQLRIIGRLKNLGLGEGDTSANDLDMDAFADFIDWIADRYTVNKEKFEEWSGGPGGMIRTLQLSMALMSELGKGMESVSS